MARGYAPGIADWVTISSLATAGGTLVLAAATYASVRSANRAARVAEASLLSDLRPLLMPSRLDDATQKIGFIDGKWFTVAGGTGVAEATDEAVYFVMSLRNASTGTAVLHGWWLYDSSDGFNNQPQLDEMIRQTRDIFVPAGDTGFWQGSFRDPSSEGFRLARRLVEARERVSIAVMYGDLEGGQRTITLFGLDPKPEEGWFLVAGRVWHVDRPPPR